MGWAAGNARPRLRGSDGLGRVGNGRGKARGLDVGGRLLRRRTVGELIKRGRKRHATGDAVLRDVAYLIRKELRAFDLAYRLGGEEFLVLLPGSGEPAAIEVAERLRQAVESCGSAGVDITISCGVASSAPGNAFDFDGVFARADFALYNAKRSGRNRVSGTLDNRVPAAALTVPD